MFANIMLNHSSCVT